MNDSFYLIVGLYLVPPYVATTTVLDQRKSVTWKLGYMWSVENIRLKTKVLVQQNLFLKALRFPNMAFVRSGFLTDLREGSVKN